MNKKYYSNFLTHKPSFLSGAARTLDLGGTFNAYNLSDTSELADERAMENDFNVVLQDLGKTIKKVVEDNT